MTNASRRPALASLALLSAVLLGGCVAGDAADPSTTPPAPTVPASSADDGGRAAGGPALTPPGDVDDPDSLAVVVNKARPLDPADWAPEDLARIPGTQSRLRPAAADAAGELVAAAADAGHDITVLSAYRSYAYQQSTYGHWVETLGRNEADRVSARPGRSEHQTGLAVDVGDASTPACDLEACFGETEAGRWVARHAAEHGFVVRYPAGAEDVTGYAPEPWHLRFVGTDAAAAVQASGLPLETAWGVGPAPDYPG